MKKIIAACDKATLKYLDEVEIEIEMKREIQVDTGRRDKNGQPIKETKIEIEKILITVDDMFAYNGKFIQLKPEEKKQVIEKMHAGLTEVNRKVLEENHIVAAPPARLRFGGVMDGAAAHFDYGSNTITLQQMQSYDAEIDWAARGVNFDPNLNPGRGLSLLAAFLHEGYAGHALAYSVYKGQIEVQLKNKLQDDIDMLTKNRGGSTGTGYFNDPAKSIYYFGYQGENWAYSSTGRTLKDLIRVVNPRTGMRYSVDYEYLRDRIATPDRIPVFSN